MSGEMKLSATFYGVGFIDAQGELRMLSPDNNELGAVLFRRRADAEAKRDRWNAYSSQQSRVLNIVMQTEDLD